MKKRTWKVIGMAKPAAPVTVEVHYVNGVIVRAYAEKWSSLRADGVDRVIVANASGSCTFKDNSAYWLYAEGDVWVAGQASFGRLRYDRTFPPEVLFLPDGSQSTRTFKFVPDLHHVAIKLGWFRPQ